MAIYALGELVPQIHDDAFVHPEAVIIGNVVVGARSSIWPTAVLRGDRGAIIVGEETSIQDGSIIHTTAEKHTIIGSRCVIGHNVHIEGVVVEDDSLIGSGSVVLAGSTVGCGALVAAGAVVSPNTNVPAGALAIGVPAKIRENGANPEVIAHSVQMYIANAKWYANDLRRID